MVILHVDFSVQKEETSAEKIQRNELKSKGR